MPFKTWTRFKLEIDGDFLALLREMIDLGGEGTVEPGVIDARRNISGVCWCGYPVVLELHRFFIAISRAVVNDDESAGTNLQPLVWSAGGPPKKRRIVHAVRIFAFWPGPAAIWE